MTFECFSIIKLLAGASAENQYMSGFLILSMKLVSMCMCVRVCVCVCVCTCVRVHVYVCMCMHHNAINK